MRMWMGFLVGAAVVWGPVPGPHTTAAPASETVVRVGLGRIDIRAAAGAANRVTVEQHDQRLYVSDVVPVVPGTGCVSVTVTTVSCAAIGVYSLSFALGDD